MVTTETIDQQPLCFRSEGQMTFLRRSHWPCSTVTLLGDTVLFLQPVFIAWKIFLIPPAFLLWKTDLRAAQLLPSVTWCHRQITAQPPQTRGTANASVTLHAKTFPMLPFQQWQESGLKSHSWAGHRPDIPVLTTAHLPFWGSCATAAEFQSTTCSLSLTPWPGTPAAVLLLTRILQGWTKPAFLACPTVSSCPNWIQKLL